MFSARAQSFGISGKARVNVSGAGLGLVRQDFCLRVSRVWSFGMFRISEIYTVFSTLRKIKKRNFCKRDFVIARVRRWYVRDFYAYGCARVFSGLSCADWCFVICRYAAALRARRDFFFRISASVVVLFFFNVERVVVF